MSERRSDAQKFYRNVPNDRQEREQAMKAKDHHPRLIINVFHGVAIILCSSALISLGQAPPSTAPPQGESPVMSTTATEQEPAATLPPEQLDSLVAPIALYSDPLLATTLAASTYPLEVIQLQQW